MSCFLKFYLMRFVGVALFWAVEGLDKVSHPGSPLVLNWVYSWMSHHLPWKSCKPTSQKRDVGHPAQGEGTLPLEIARCVAQR